MASAEATDAAADLERELNDRFGPPPAPVRNLLYIVRLRVLAKRAHVASIAREDGPAGGPVLSLRTFDGYELSGQLSAPARRDLEREDGVSIGRAQLRIDLDAAGARWREILLHALEAAAGAEAAA